MAYSFANFKSILQNEFGLGDSGDDDTDLGRILNEAARDVWVAWEWHERYKEAYFNTVAPYTTGTVTVTNASATVTGAGTTFPTFSNNTRKFALGYGDPSYLITSRDSATQLTLSRTYAGSTAAAQSYTLFSDIYDIATDVDTIEDVRLHHGPPHGGLVHLSRRYLDRADYIPGTTNRPYGWSLVPYQTAGTVRIQVWPVPDAVYTVSVLYLKSYTDMSVAADTTGLNDNRQDLVLWRAREKCAVLTRQLGDAASFASRFETLLHQAIAREKVVRPAVTQFRRFDEYAETDFVTLRLPIDE